MEKIGKNYQNGELQKIHKKVKSQSGKLRKSFIYRRNFLMTQNLIGQFERGPVFAAVGAGHLWEGKGMLRYLSNKGFKISPVKWPSFASSND